MARNALSPFRSSGLMGSDPLLSLHQEMNRLFDDFMHGSGVPARQGSDAILLTPEINVSETDGEIRVTAELPGVTEKDIQVDLRDDFLVIRAEKKLDRKEEKENFHFVERSYGTFQRSLRLPFPVDPGQVQAKFEDGVLSITLPKSAQQARSRRIQVEAGGGKSSDGQSAKSKSGGAAGGSHTGSQAAEDQRAG